MKNEVWRDVKGYKGLYQISSKGRLKSLSRPVRHARGGFRVTKQRIIEPRKGKRGYFVFTLSKEGQSSQRYAHRLIAIAFIPNPEGKPHINHRNGVKDDNRIKNLEWCTHQENHLHRFRALGYRHSKKVIESTIKKGYANGKRTRCTETGVIYRSAQEASEKTGIAMTSIARARRGLLKTAGGYRWEFAS